MGSRSADWGAICGTPFLEHALAIEWQHGDLTLRGWVADPNHTTAALAEIQYCYVNGRMMRDRLINHAIRQACEDKLGADQQPAFVLYLEIDPHQVDVNVHPAKHEVRFHQSRLVHDFIYQGVLSVLQQQLETPLPLADDDEPAPRHIPENRVVAAGVTILPNRPRRVNLRHRVTQHLLALAAVVAVRRGPVGLMPSLDIKSSRVRFISNCYRRRFRRVKRRFLKRHQHL